ncbi:hypothetical protein RRG08_066134 [Elysia crispata]|uniref:Ig-like domain-containing protein n=1 Tax=Elysia crispata TaxID=231223 RepID=A0AAE1BBE7_9GAST|nr:hypothetical protein RRG08_066134 [Elysia crispata]
MVIEPKAILWNSGGMDLKFHHQLQPYQGVLENDEVVLRCTANVGSPDKVSVLWRVYRKNVSEDISSADNRLSSIKIKQPCTDLVSSTLTLKMTRDDQNLVAACFVSNDDFAPASSLPRACEDTILYPVSVNTLVMTHHPQKLYEGASVTLICRAEGFPEPSIVWLEGTKTLQGEKRGVGISRLVLRNLAVDGDSGEYICVATNDPRGAIASANKSINIYISVRIIHEAETTINLTYSNKTFPAMQGSTAYFDCGCYNLVAVRVQTLVKSAVTLTLKVPPSAPAISVLSGDLAQGVLENDVVVLGCTANVGSPGKGRVHWRVYRWDIPEDISSTDSRLSSINTQPDQQLCTELQQICPLPVKTQSCVTRQRGYMFFEI